MFPRVTHTLYFSSMNSRDLPRHALLVLEQPVIITISIISVTFLDEEKENHALDGGW